MILVVGIICYNMILIYDRYIIILIMIKPEIGTVKIIINVKDGLIKKSIHNNIPILIISWKNVWKDLLNATLIQLISFNIIDRISPVLFLSKKDSGKFWTDW